MLIIHLGTGFLLQLRGTYQNLSPHCTVAWILPRLAIYTECLARKLLPTPAQVQQKSISRGDALCTQWPWISKCDAGTQDLLQALAWRLLWQTRPTRHDALMVEGAKAVQYLPS